MRMAGMGISSPEGIVAGMVEEGAFMFGIVELVGVVLIVVDSIIGKELWLLFSRV